MKQINNKIKNYIILYIYITHFLFITRSVEYHLQTIRLFFICIYIH